MGKMENLKKKKRTLPTSSEEKKTCWLKKPSPSPEGIDREDMANRWNKGVKRFQLKLCLLLK
eukprot:1146382-Pelagomonas_calceolata.AAC.1